MEERIGFVGLGVMGAPMARNLARKLGQLTAYDVVPAKVAALASEGVQSASSLAELGERSEVVLLSLPDSETVEEVVMGGGKLADSMAAGGVIVDTSTTEPAVSVRVARSLGERGLHFLDAPVSGGEKAAVEGTLAFMVGGEEGVFERCLPILKCMGTSVVRLGGAGAGGVAKMVNQMIVGATFAVVAESFALGTKAGLDPGVLFEAIRHGWAGSRVLEVAAAAMLARDFRPGGTVDIHCKDLRYALSLAASTDVPVPVTAITREIFTAARASGSGRLSQPAVVTLWEKLLGVTVTAKG
ncbi:MAG: NAD(P)-dependent oxidoreductase [Armatimonadota bacterium]